MNCLAFFLVLLVCGAAYYSHTISDARVTELEDQVNAQNDQLIALHADNQKLNEVINTANMKLKAAGQPMVEVPAPSAPGEQGAPAESTAVAATAAAPVPAPAPMAAPTPTPPVITPTAPAPPATNAPVAASATPAILKPDQMALGIVVIKGDNAEGTGFLVKTADGPAVITNLHVLANNPHIKIQTSAGVQITPTGMKGASDRDLAMLPIADGPYTYLPLAPDVSKVAHGGDADVTPGNSQGGDVVLSTPGSVVAIGPDRVEFNNPIYHGNSGGPVFHTPSGTVIGVVTEAMKVEMTNDLDKASFASRNSAIAGSMRYFGLRLDTVPKWEPYEMTRYQDETRFLDDFDKQSRALDAYLNPPKQSNNPNQASSSDERLYEKDERIMAAHHTFRQAMAGTDTAGQITALRELSFSLDGIADKGLEAVKSPANFYSFDLQRAHEAVEYRQALKKEIQEFSSDVNRIGDLPRSN